jgi:S-adenosylmethionine:tRNA ribosyltransferase-isomerase
MGTNISLFDYNLPEAFIAQHSVEPRDHSQLMVFDRETGELQHKQFFSILEELRAGDVLVFNTSKVFKARLVALPLQGIPSRQGGVRGGSGEGMVVRGSVEIFVLRVHEGFIDALIKPGKKFPIGSSIEVFGHSFTVEAKTADGVVRLKTDLSAREMLEFCDEYGQIPTPPYVSEKLDDTNKYQTVYAKEVGSVAAPTAGFHFTEELLDKIKAKGVEIEHVILHVGIGTFRPVLTDTIEEHVMHSEWVSLSQETTDHINRAKSEGRRVIAVGTTTTRVLEGIAVAHSPSLEEGVTGEGPVVAYEGEINIFITPGFVFKVIDGLITNFHLPKSTLLVLISSFAGRENVLHAYEEAKKNGYRFFSFGDAMFIR